MNTDARRAIEALRAGVPNREAVARLRSGQPAIEERFGRHLRALEENTTASPQKGFILGGDFGTGKSHVLQHLKQEALARGFATSLVVVSKETPLSDLDLVYKAAIKELRLPDRQSGDLSEVAIKLEPRSREYDDFEAMVRHGSEPLDPLFAATLQINRSLSPSDDLQDAIYAFWAGGRVNVTQVRKALRPLPNTGLVLKAKKSADLAADRFRFASGLIRAGGYRGWVILIDEVELVASLSQRARARAYVDLTWILGFSDRPLSGVLAVAAATSEFTGVIFNEKQDDVKIPLSKMAEKEPALVERAVRALRAIDERSGNWEPIKAQTDDDLDRVFREVRELYRLAFDWEGVGKARPPYRDVGRSMRMHVREWITRWDLERLDPLYSADIAADVLRPDLEEREGLEGFSEPDDSDDGSDWSGGVVAY